MAQGKSPRNPLAFASVLYPGRCLAVELANPWNPPGAPEGEIPVDAWPQPQRRFSSFSHPTCKYCRTSTPAPPSLRVPVVVRLLCRSI